VDGLKSVINPDDGRIYGTFNQTGTATGRISSSEPNLQNIPVRLELGRELRKAFVPADGFIFMDADYSQIELRVLAHMSQDACLTEAFKNNADIHALTASQVFGVPENEVTRQQRTAAKAVNFGIIYGMGGFSLSEDIGITKKEADKYIEGYFKTYPLVKTFLDAAVSSAKENGFARTIFGRRRMIPEISAHRFFERAFGERVAMNAPVQGSAADIIKIAMVNVHKALKEKGLLSRIILQVHDELLLEVKKEEADAVKVILKEEMENCVKLLVPLIADVREGCNWYETK
jgi:DNA polymerase-1